MSLQRSYDGVETRPRRAATPTSPPPTALPTSTTRQSSARRTTPRTRRQATSTSHPSTRVEDAPGACPIRDKCGSHRAIVSGPLRRPARAHQGTSDRFRPSGPGSEGRPPGRRPSPPSGISRAPWGAPGMPPLRRQALPSASRVARLSAASLGSAGFSNKFGETGSVPAPHPTMLGGEGDGCGAGPARAEVRGSASANRPEPSAHGTRSSKTAQLHPVA